MNYTKSSGRDIWDAMHYPFRPNNISEYMEDNSELYGVARSTDDALKIIGGK